ncbi:MAG: PEP-CTERM sorting domain-containing protein, partial [Armatimonadota bacterium]
MRKVLVLSFTLVVLFSLVCTTFADDLVAPPWQRYSPGTTYALWEFNYETAPGAPVVADDYYNPYGIPTARPYPGVGQSYISQWGGREGLWPLSGTIEVDINNQPIANPYKDIWIQLTWAKQTVDSIPYISELLSGATGTLVGQHVVLGPTGYVGDWYHSVYQIRIYPNPSFETIKIDGTIVVDQLVIDTICVPEPANILALVGGLAGIGGFAIRRRK